MTDATGRVVADVQVVAVKDATGLRRETVSSGQGNYEITELPVGVYTVSFVRTGFETLRFENVV
ncbi:MAG TPA: carboxypeptidase-like regulatory domain-containing protein, partial [Gemmataceae bacterium]|nr:carboxypeptidase-like regulatory domain-containing protein [Gemmataceae bacterium]